jgi:hypothetical protein
MTMGTATLLLECLRHFVHLDEANAAIHLGMVCYSPITFRLAEECKSRYLEIVHEQGDVYDLYVERVMAHVGQYEEDRGR